jgi:hypothetical protein
MSVEKSDEVNSKVDIMNSKKNKSKKKGRHHALKGMWADAEKICGGVACLARRLGVHPSAIRRYSQGEMVPKQSVKILLDQVLSENK